MTTPKKIGKFKKKKKKKKKEFRV